MYLFVKYPFFSRWKLRIRAKILLLSVLLLVLTIGLTDGAWFLTIRPLIETRVSDTQQEIGQQAIVRVEEFVRAKVRALIIHSQTVAFLTNDSTPRTLEFQTFFLQDPDLKTLAVLDGTGQETLKLDRFRQVDESELENRKSSPSYVFTTFRYGKEYVGEIIFSEDNEPELVIAVPIIVPRQFESLTRPSTATGGTLSEGDILGVLEATVSVSNLFTELQNLSSPTVGAIYVVDTTGKIIAHPNTADVPLGTDFTQFEPVARHIQNIASPDHAAESFEFINEDNEPVIATLQHVPERNWGVVVQQPTKLAFAEFNRVTLFALGVFIGGVILAIGFAYLLSGTVTAPIYALMAGVRQLRLGNRSVNINVATGDELEELANQFNSMTKELNSSYEQVEKDRDIIEAERNKLSLILEGVDDAIIALDKNNKVVLINRSGSDLLNWETEDATNKSIDEIMFLYDEPTNERIVAKDYCQNILKNELSKQNYAGFNIKLVTKQGKERFVNLVSSVVTEGDVVGVRFLITLHDLTKETELERMKLDFVSMAAHELRTPITTVRGYMSFLRQDATYEKLATDEKEFLNRAIISASNLNNLVENLLNVSRIEKGAMKTDLQPQELMPVIERVVSELEQMVLSKGLSISIERLDEPLPLVYADRFRIEEVLRNLVGNAINYTQHGKITVRAFKKGDTVRTEIEDTGQGIPEEAIPHLFTKFFRVEGELQSGSKGTGLGLFISKRIIDAHSGEIGVNSTQGHGSIFYFSLPIVK